MKIKSYAIEGAKEQRSKEAKEKRRTGVKE